MLLQTHNMIDRIIIDNFKSIKHADVRLQKVNLLIGPNNSGKSNFLKSVVAVKTGYKNQNGLDFKISKNNLDNLQTELVVFFNDDTIASSKENFDNLGEITQEQLNIKAKNFRTGLQTLYETLSGCVIYKPDINKLHKPFRMYQNDESILEDASNITSFLQTCLNKHRRVFNRISDELKEILPLFEEIIIDTVNNDHKNHNQAPEVKIGIRDKADRTIWAEDLSEGVLYFIALLCIIHQPNPPKVLLLEEPERSMHPRRIKEVIDLIRKLSDEKDIQVIMTTHSPLVVDLFEDEPECIHVFEMKDGFTEIKNLKTDIIDPTNQELRDKGLDVDKDYGITLGEQWVYGYLGGVPV